MDHVICNKEIIIIISSSTKLIVGYSRSYDERTHGCVCKAVDLGILIIGSTAMFVFTKNDYFRKTSERLPAPTVNEQVEHFLKLCLKGLAFTFHFLDRSPSLG